MLRKAVRTVRSLYIYGAPYDSMPAVALCFLCCLYRFYGRMWETRRKSNPLPFDRVFRLFLGKLICRPSNGCPSEHFVVIKIYFLRRLQCRKRLRDSLQKILHCLLRNENSWVQDFFMNIRFDIR